MAKGVEKLVVFKEAHALVLKIYEITRDFPSDERFRLVDQMIRAAYSIPANIAEGSGRRSLRDYVYFLQIARGSVNELKYFLFLSKDLKYIKEEDFHNLNEHANKVNKMLNRLISSLKNKIKN